MDVQPVEAGARWGRSSRGVQPTSAILIQSHLQDPARRIHHTYLITIEHLLTYAYQAISIIRRARWLVLRPFRHAHIGVTKSQHARDVARAR
jgi:hypothetical protein